MERGENSITQDSHRLSEQIAPVFDSLHRVVSALSHVTQQA